MSCSVRLEALPPGVFDTVFTQENIGGRRSSMNSLTSLSFPRSRAALWDGSPVGEKLFLQLFSNRNPRLVLLEKALRLAQRHVRQSDKPSLQCFFLGSVLVDPDEEGVTVTLDRFDPGRDQPGSSVRVPCAMLPGDVLVPCLFLTRSDSSDAVQSESDLHQCFKSLQQQLLSGRQNLDLGRLLKVGGHIVCSQQSDATVFSLSWSSVCPSVGLDIHAVRAVPIIPTALLRSLTSTPRPLPHPTSCQKGFLTMDQTRKLLLLLETDPKACSLPLVGLWLSGVTHVSNPHVWVWCLQFLFSSALLDRVFSDSDYFLLVLFCSTHKSPQFFKCGRSGLGSGPRLDYKLLTASQCVTLYQVGAVEGQALHFELSSERHSRQVDVFRMAQLSFNSSTYPATAVCANDQDSGVEDEDLSPRPSPSPHLPTQQVRRVQPSVPELSLLVDNSFTSIQTGASCRAPPPPSAWKSTLSAGIASCSAVPQSPSHPIPHHSTPYSNLQQPCSCCTSHSCTSIHSSPRFLPGVSPESPQQTTPPQSSLSSQQKTPPQSSLSSQQKTPPPSSLSSQQKTPPPSSLSSQQKTPPPSSLSSQQKTPPPSSLSSQQKTPPPSSLSSQQKKPPPSSSHHDTYLPFCHHHIAPSLLPSSNISTSTLGALPKYPPSPSTPPASPCTPTSAPPWPPSHPGDAPYHLTSRPADPPPAPWIMPPPYVNRCWDQAGALDTYQLLLQQDRQLRLLQSQVQMLLEAQGKYQPSAEPVRTTASIAVGTGASLFWADPVQPASALEAPLPPSSEASPLVSSPSCAQRSPADTNVSTNMPVDGPEDDNVKGQEVQASHFDDYSSIQSPVLGESASMYSPSDDNPNFYKDLMTQLTSRLQEADSRQGGEEEDLRKRRLSASPDHSQSSQVKPSPRRTQQPCGDHVVSATLQELRRLGVNVDGESLSESDRKVQQTVESSSTLASINPAAVVSRLSVSEQSFSSLLPCGSVDLSLEANAIALRYLSDSQLSRLSLGGHPPHKGHASSNNSLLSPNMSVATRKYMRKYGLIEEEVDGDEVEERSSRKALMEAQGAETLPQGQLINNPRPKMQLLTEGAKLPAQDKEKSSIRRPSLPRAEGSVGNILDLSRLRQLPKLF